MDPIRPPLRGCEYCGHYVRRPCGTYEEFAQCHNVYPNAECGGTAEAPDKPQVALIPDNINTPEHYAGYAIEPITFIMVNKLPYAEGNVVKYVCRHDKKNGLEDIEKAVKYLKFIAKDTYGVEL